jgi:hypothetical protein
MCLPPQADLRDSAKPIAFRPLIRGLGHLAVSSGNQTFGDQQKSWEYQGVNHRDRDYADGKTTVVVVEISTQYIAKSCAKALQRPLLTQSGYQSSLNDPISNRYDARIPRFGCGNETA